MRFKQSIGLGLFQTAASSPSDFEVELAAPGRFEKLERGAW